MVVANQDDIGGMQSFLNLLRVEKRIVVAEGVAELAKIFAAAVRILSADFTFHSGQRVELRRHCGGIARLTVDAMAVLSSQFSVLGSQSPLLDFRCSASLCSKLGARYPLVGGFLPHHPPQNLTIATTGASGSVFLRQLLLAVERDARVQTVNFIASDSGLRVLAEELGIEGRSKLVPPDPGRRENQDRRPDASNTSSKIKEQSNADIGANVASGSYPADAMIVIPCSVGTLARIANGIASHLIERAADVCLKEKRPLVLCVRETPLNKIHIRNMYRAADAGATVFPLIPAFYYRPAILDDMAREFAYRVLAHIGLPQPDAFQLEGLKNQRLGAPTSAYKPSRPPKVKDRTLR